MGIFDVFIRKKTIHHPDTCFELMTSNGVHHEFMSVNLKSFFINTQRREKNERERERETGIPVTKLFWNILREK